jgi:hypothetical protein
MILYWVNIDISNFFVLRFNFENDWFIILRSGFDYLK